MVERLRVRTDGTAPPTVDLDGADAPDWFREHHDAVDAALAEHGALYFAGAGLRDRAEFAAVRDAAFLRRAEYREKATPRTDFGSGVYSSTDLPPSQPIRQHNENSYTLTFPGRLLFGCLTAADTGGATTVADVRRVLETLPDKTVARMCELGWRLHRTYHDTVGLSWQVAFSTTDPADVEAYCADNAIGCRWVDDELRTEQVRPGVVEHPVTGERVWFNHAAFWSQWSLEDDIREILVGEFGVDRLPFNTAYGDGTALPEDDVAAMNRAYDEATRRLPWRRGDLLLVDNLLSSHGRDAFTGRRDVVVAMGDPLALADLRTDGPGAEVG
ncbi:TauD/TfdA family dioxygenase [Amycolatopsis sp. cmx-4-54]|uniref:TauD/TfdA family dioxygenase n=1 Tax=Amycolatopsis sp. cmx-4-54 TaxID=2790936 RepID=UPI00397DAD6D